MKIYLKKKWEYLNDSFYYIYSSPLGNFVFEKILFRSKGFYTILYSLISILILQLGAYSYETGVIQKLDDLINKTDNIFIKDILYFIQFFIPEGNIYIIIAAILLIIALFVDRYLQKESIRRLNIDQAFKQWSSQTEVKLISKLVTSSREKQIKELIKILQDNPSKIIVNSLNEQESYAFILSALKDNKRFSKKVNILTTQDVWNKFAEKKNKILIYQGFTPDNIGLAIENGNFVIEANESIDIKDHLINTINLPKIKRTIITDVLQEMGFDYDESWKIYNETKGYLHAIISHPLLKPLEKIIPDWVEKYDISFLSSVLFINSWNRTNEFDKKVIEELSGVSYDDYEKNLYSLKDEKKPPIRLVGNVWQVISKISLWDLAARKITASQIDKLRELAINVISEIDPSFELPATDRWTANIYNKTLNHSGLIRESIADTLVFISVFGKTSLSYQSDINATIDYSLNKLFELNLNVEAWYSYGRSLPLLAEASPNSFLKSIEKTLNNKDTTKIEELFEKGDLTMGSCFHCNLLWALETISWNHEYLSRVTLVLIRLNELDIKNKISNSPLNTLKDIFAGWIVYSSVSHENKIQILENIAYRKFPEGTWKLLIELLPDRHSISSGISRPKYQNWDDDISKEVTREELNTYNKNIYRILFTNIDKDTNKWKDIIENIDKFNKDYCIDFLNKFIMLDVNIFNEEERLSLSLELRTMIHNYREFVNSDNWNISDDCLEKIEKAFYYIEPTNLAYKYYYLFGNGSVDILNPIPYDSEARDSYKANDELIENERESAVKDILESSGFATLVELIKMSGMPGIIGRLLFKITGDEHKNELLNWLNLNDGYLNVCSKNYISNMNFDESLFVDLNDLQRSEVLLAINFDSIAFELLKKQNIEVQKLYWENISFYYRIEGTDKDYIKWIFEQFSKFKLYSKSIDFISHQIRKTEEYHLAVDPNDIADILIEMDPNEPNQLRHYSISKVIKLLQNSDVDNDKIKSIEWKYLQLKSFNPIYINKNLITNPKAFVEMFTFIYKPENGVIENNEFTQEQISNHYTNAKKILERFSIFKEYEDINPLTFDKLKDWINEVIENAKKVNREKYAYIEIGKVLSKSPKGEDDIFPNEITREILEIYDHEEIGYYFWHEKKYPGGSYFTSRGADEGGDQERRKAKEFKEYAEKLKYSYFKTSSLLLKLSKDYEKDADREDLNNELN